MTYMILCLARSDCLTLRSTPTESRYLDGYWHALDPSCICYFSISECATRSYSTALDASML